MGRKHKKTKKDDGSVEAARIQAAAIIKAAWISFWALILVAIIGLAGGYFLQCQPEPPPVKTTIAIEQVQIVNQHFNVDESPSSTEILQSPTTPTPSPSAGQ